MGQNNEDGKVGAGEAGREFPADSRRPQMGRGGEVHRIMGHKIMGEERELEWQTDGVKRIEDGIQGGET